MRKIILTILLTLTICSRAEAATRFYFSDATAADVSSGYGGWTGTGLASRWYLDSSLVHGTLASGSTISWATSTGQTHLDRQYVSAPLSAQTITGTVKMQLKTREGTSTDNINQIILLIRVVNNLGNTYTGTVLSLGSYGPTTEYNTDVPNGHLGGRNKTGANGDTLTDLAINQGDRLVVEIGHSNSVSGTTPEAFAIYGESSGVGDLPENETSQVDENPWVEFSMNISFFNPVNTVDIKGASILGATIQ